ncbi:MAG: hydroxyacid dehydrogenase, partial [Candidatus Thermoplasmatota archaeon]|nr:hydroxyacid dehydrogenase [Candidatus Thermoplasmatota archaeon]
IHPAGVETLEQAGHEVLDQPDEATFDEALPRAAGLIVRSATQVTPDLIERAGELKVVGRAGVGVDNIDLDACKARGIVVANTPGASTNAVAELTFAHMLAAARNLPLAITSMRQGEWTKKECKGHELKGRTLGLVGIGRIGARVAELAQAFGMQVEAFDPYVTQERAEQLGVAALHEDVLDLAASVDVVSVHTPLTPETKGLVGQAFFEAAGEGLIVVNCARGGVVDEAALVDALDAGQVLAAGLDVYAQEPPGRTEVTTHQRVSTTPHVGAATHEAQREAGVLVAQAVLDGLAGKDPESRVA